MYKPCPFQNTTNDLDASAYSLVFSFFSNAHNLAEITPPVLHLKAVLTPAPIEMSQFCTVTLIDYRIKLRGIPIRWQTEITEWNPPHDFVDVQRRGPYRLGGGIHIPFWRQNMGSSSMIQSYTPYGEVGLLTILFVRPDLDTNL